MCLAIEKLNLKGSIVHANFQFNIGNFWRKEFEQDC